MPKFKPRAGGAVADERTLSVSGFMRQPMGVRLAAVQEALVILLLLLVAIPLSATETAWEIPISHTYGGVYVTAMVDKKPLSMLVDTGSASTVFRHKLGAQGSVQLIRGAAGAALATHCFVDMALNGHTVPISAICGVDLPVGQDGLLGADFFQQFSSVTLDYQHQQINLVRR